MSHPTERAGTIITWRQPASAGSVIFPPDIGGGIFYAKKLVSHLEHGCGIYGLSVDSKLLKIIPGCTIQGLAEHYADDLRAAGLPEPFHLVGHCFAGFLAFEIARDLTRHGARVETLALLDTNLPSRYYSGWHYRILPAAGALTNGCGNLLKTFINKRPEGNPAMDLNVPGFIHVDLTKYPRAYHDIIRHFFHAMLKYQPGPYAGNLTLFQAMNRRGLYAAPKYMGWEKFITGNLDVIRLEGDHLQMVNDDSVSNLLAENLNRIISAADATLSIADSGSRPA